MIATELYMKIMETMPVVCVDCIIQNPEGKFLLVHRKNEPLKGENWVPGGRLFKNETLEQAVYRKMKDELGVNVEIINNIGFFEDFFEKTHQNVAGGFHAISFVFHVRIGDQKIKLNDENTTWGWFDKLPERLTKYKYLNTGMVQ